MDNKAIKMVIDYLMEHVDEAIDHDYDFEACILWECSTLQKQEYILSSNWPGFLLYKVTYYNDKKEWHLDIYAKEQTRVVEDE